MPSLAGCLSSSLGIRWMERPGSFTVGTMLSLPFMGSERELDPRGGELSLFICLASLLRYPSWESRWRGIPEIIRTSVFFYFNDNRTTFFYCSYLLQKRSVSACQQRPEEIMTSQPNQQVLRAASSTTISGQETNMNINRRRADTFPLNSRTLSAATYSIYYLHNK